MKNYLRDFCMEFSEFQFNNQLFFIAECFENSEPCKTNLFFGVK